MLPNCEPFRPGESIVDHGARVLVFLLATDCTATLSDLELERAEIAAKYAIVARGISVPAADRISDCRHLIALILKGRKPAPAPMGPASSCRDDRPNTGPMARLQDRPITRLPAPDHAIPEIRF